MVACRAPDVSTACSGVLRASFVILRFMNENALKKYFVVPHAWICIRSDACSCRSTTVLYRLVAPYCASVSTPDHFPNPNELRVNVLFYLAFRCKFSMLSLHSTEK